jgi:uncharacterized damage-inducible protein DinB
MSEKSPTEIPLEELQYPIGKLASTPTLPAAQRPALIDEIADLPGELADAVAGLTDTQLDTPYRPGGWTVRQVVHHLADAHLNGYARFKFAMTEVESPIRPYDQTKWAELPDAKAGPIAPSLELLIPLHEKWVDFLRNLSEEDFGRIALHPVRGPVTVDFLLQLYAWHGRHHVGHITSLRNRERW